MKVIPVLPGTGTSREVKKLYREAFPPEERYPYWRMLLLGMLCPKVKFLAYTHQGEFCGFTLTARSEKYLYINFIAVPPEKRSEGWGTRILGELDRRCPNKAMLVEVMAPREDAPDQDQRLRRLAFYERNGFFDLDRSVSGKGGDFMLLSTTRVYDRAAYWEIFENMSLKKVFTRFFSRA